MPILPIPGKGGSDWSYAWIPVVGPIIGGILGVRHRSMARFVEPPPTKLKECRPGTCPAGRVGIEP